MKMSLATEIALVILLKSFVHCLYLQYKVFACVSESKVICRVHDVWPRVNHSQSIR